jgi:hypothetical protein
MLPWRAIAFLRAIPLGTGVTSLGYP